MKAGKKNRFIVCMMAVALLFSMTGCSKSKAETTTDAGVAAGTETPATTAPTTKADGKADQNTTAALGAENITDANVTEITFWYSWTDQIQQNNIDLTEEFNETVGKEKGIHVTAEYQGSYVDLHQKLQAAYVAGTTPAVTVMEIASIETFAANGVLEPLDPYIEATGTDMSDFQQGLMQNSYYNGGCYGLPYLRSTPIMYMNTTLLEQAGLDKTGPKTWDELKEYITTVHDKTGKYGLTQYGYIWTLEAFMLEHGSSLLNADETATNLNSAEGKEIIRFFKELADAGAVHMISSAETDKVMMDVMNQNCAIWFGSTGDLTNCLKVAADNGFEVATSFIPMDKQYGVPTGGCNLIMTSSISDKEKQAAWEFISWMTETEQTIKASTNTGYLPSRISAIENDAMVSLYEQVPQFKVALDQLTYGTGRPMNPGYAEASDAIEDTLDAIWVNNADIDSTLAELEKKVNGLLNE
ncbi:MAG: ABC transporter substrate-binding protein [Lachnospiraceae bacterium]|nr:ABC transporter substrate-binding protein [Lachnospiraceae bacterium]